MGATASRLHPDMRDRLKTFLRLVTSADGEPVLSESKQMRLDGRLDCREQVVVDTDSRLIGYGQAAWHRGSDGAEGHWALEIVVEPRHRDGSTAEVLIQALRREAEGSDVILWARNNYVADAACVLGWHRQRELLEMRRSLPIDCGSVSLRGFNVSTFRMGVDEAAWLRANNAAFTGHPENGSLTRRDLEQRIAQSWFDPAGFLLAWDGEELAGSCWTKIHDDGVGEIYIVGVVPGWEGRGLGKALVCLGLDYLGNVRHLTKAKLFVEGDNERAVGLYGTLGFEKTRTIEAFSPLVDGVGS